MSHQHHSLNEPKINTDTLAILRSKDMADRLPGLGMNVIAGTPDQLAARVNSENLRWGKVVREANIKVE